MAPGEFTPTPLAGASAARARATFVLTAALAAPSLRRHEQLDPAGSILAGALEALVPSLTECSDALRCMGFALDVESLQHRLGVVVETIDAVRDAATLLCDFVGVNDDEVDTL
jgi:hypothetical protein